MSESLVIALASARARLGGRSAPRSGAWLSSLGLTMASAYKGEPRGKGG